MLGRSDDGHLHRDLRARWPSNAAVTITALYNSVSRKATLTVTAPTASTLTLNPTSVQGGNTSTGTVTLNGPAPSGGMVVTLTSSRTATAQVQTVTVAGGRDNGDICDYDRGGDFDPIRHNFC